MKVLLGHDRLVANYVNEKIGIDVTGGTPYVGLAITDEVNNFAAGLVVSNFNGISCEVSMASESATWARKGILKYIANYIFIKNQCIRCQLVIRKHRSTWRVRKLVQKLGFTLEGTLKRAYDGRDDALIFGLLAENCRFLGGVNGQIQHAKTASGARSVCDGAGANTVQ